MSITERLDPFAHDSPLPTADQPVLNESVLNSISLALNGLRYGSVEIVVHEGKVTQIERKEKIRL